MGDRRRPRAGFAFIEGGASPGRKAPEPLIRAPGAKLVTLEFGL